MTPVHLDVWPSHPPASSSHSSPLVHLTLYDPSKTRQQPIAHVTPVHVDVCHPHLTAAHHPLAPFSTSHPNPSRIKPPPRKLGPSQYITALESEAYMTNSTCRISKSVHALAPLPLPSSTHQGGNSEMSDFSSTSYSSPLRTRTTSPLSLPSSSVFL